MKKSEIINKLKKEGCGYEDIMVDTYYDGYDGNTYDATAILRIEEDGRHHITYYSYQGEDGMIDTEERDWDKNSIEQTFKIEIDY